VSSILLAKFDGPDCDGEEEEELEEEGWEM
jgi:hypothetical protein